jgi:LAS superfamily LD-carboxypeptidase LdcB
VLVATVAIAAALGSTSLVSSSLTVPSPSTASWPSSAAPPVDRRQRDALGEAGGAVPRGTTVFDDEVPGVANLDPALLRALRRAATDAAADGVELIVNSGWRSPAYEDRLRREAIAKYG